MRGDWDAIVVGASFAGLLAAEELAQAGRVLLIDKDEIGEGQTSACATPVEVLERLDATETIEQVHRDLVVHLPGGVVRAYQPAYQFATFDYRGLCRLLADRGRATFLKARVKGPAAGGVATSAGTFTAPVLMDASGWRCVLGTAIDPGLKRAVARSVGLEARLPHTGEGLHFWIGDGIARDGYLWDFPAGDHSRVGLLRYRSGGGLKQRLARFVDRDVDTVPLHGGVLPSRIRDPVAGDVFLIGDAAGQCLPLSGEGIRPALVYGRRAGRLGRQVLEGTLSLPDALAEYRRLALRPRTKYRLLASVERTMPYLPGKVMEVVSWYFGAGPLSPLCQGAYWRIAPAEAL